MRMRLGALLLAGLVFLSGVGIGSSAGFRKLTEDAEFQKIMKEVGQPVMYMGPEAYEPWLVKAYDDYGKFIRLSGVETK